MFGGPTLYVFFSVNLDEFDHDLTWSRHWNDGEGKGDHFQVAASFSYVQVSELYIYIRMYIYNTYYDSAIQPDQWSKSLNYGVFFSHQAHLW